MRLTCKQLSDRRMGVKIEKHGTVEKPKRVFTKDWRGSEAVIPKRRCRE